jgi:hypothetical protein
MTNAQYSKDWRKEILLTLRFVTAFERLTEKQQIEFLTYMYNNNMYQKGVLTLLSEKTCTQYKEQMNVNPENIPIMLDFHKEKV